MKIFKKIIIIILLFIVILALFFIYAGTNKEFGRKFLHKNHSDQNYSGGDLYNYSGLNRFKENRIRIPLENSTICNGSDMIIKGDSFFNTGWDSSPVPNYLQKISGKNIFYHSTTGSEITPLEYLEKFSCRNGETRFFIWETIERNSITRVVDLESDFSNRSKKGTVSIWAKIKNNLFYQDDIEFFIKNNLFFRAISLWFKNLAFEWFGIIDSKTPLYLDDPNMLFYENEINFNKNKHKLSYIDKIANNIAKEADVIKDRYNLTLVFLIIPNKFSIYGEQILGEDEHDDFIPKLQTALELRGVSYVDVYDAFKNYQREHPNELLYYAGDTHYLPVGKKILIDELINAGIGLDSKVIE